MTIHGNPRSLTDEQWTRIIEIISLAQPLELIMPVDGKVTVDLIIGDTKFVILPDGSYLKFTGEYDGG